MATIEQQFKDEAYYTKAIATALRIGFVGLLIILSYLILKPFLVVVMWGIIIAVGIYPLFKKFAALFGNRKKLASTINNFICAGNINYPIILFNGIYNRWYTKSCCRIGRRNI